MKKLRAYTIIILFGLSCLVYLIFRENIILYEFIDKPFEIYLQNTKIPNWVVYNLPDAIWVMTLSYCLIFIWDCKVKKTNILWVSSPFFIAFSLELGQKYNLVNGTYDKLDLIFILLGSAIPIIELIKTKHHEKTIS